MANVRLDNVTKEFGPHTAVRDLTLDIADGEFFVLLGPTGAGKTTILRLIAGLDKPTSGRIVLGGEDMSDWTVAQRDVKTGVQDGDKIQILSGIKPGDTVVVDGADRLRDGADVEIPNLTGKIAAPSGNAADAARAAQRAQLEAAAAKACSADLKKLCPTATPGREARMCLFQHREELSAGCDKARALTRRGGGGRRGGRGGGGGTP